VGSGLLESVLVAHDHRRARIVVHEVSCIVVAIPSETTEAVCPLCVAFVGGIAHFDSRPAQALFHHQKGG